jgi:hypothetical protein
MATLHAYWMSWKDTARARKLQGGPSFLFFARDDDDAYRAACRKVEEMTFGEGQLIYIAPANDPRS